MLKPFLMGLAAGQRSMTPLAALAGAARHGKLPADNPAAKLMAHPVIATGAVALAAAEMAGDKMKTAPDRIVPLGLIARTITGLFVGYALSPRNERIAGAAVCAGTALAASYVGWSLRMKALRRYGQTPTGFVEEALVFPAAWRIANGAARA